MAKKLANIQTIDGHDFTWTVNMGVTTGVADRSDLSGKQIFCRIYDDAMDVGFYVKGIRETKLFTHCHTACDGHPGIAIDAWHFVADTGERIIIYND